MKITIYERNFIIGVNTLSSGNNCGRERMAHPACVEAAGATLPLPQRGMVVSRSVTRQHYWPGHCRFKRGVRIRAGAEACWLTKKEGVKRPDFPVTSALMPPHEPRHSYEHCIVCHKPFRVYRSRLLRPVGMFCTQCFFWQACRAFRP